MIIRRDKWGIIPALFFGRFSIVWSWPRDGMAWFFWNFGGAYRMGPVTVNLTND